MSNWIEYQLGDLLGYEQPTPYIVESTDYNDQYKTPVLTAGKSFILGYTNEETGIYDALPVIIFDDFTMASQYVNFPFKVKSSAMKILTANAELVLPKFIFYRMQTIQFDHGTHKRYWIQQYSKIRVKIPSIPEQQRIVSRIEELLSQLDSGVETLNTVTRQLAAYRQSTLKDAFDHAMSDCKMLPIAELLTKDRKGMSTGPFGTMIKKADHKSSGVPMLGIENIGKGQFIDGNKIFTMKHCLRGTTYLGIIPPYPQKQTFAGMNRETEVTLAQQPCRLAQTSLTNGVFSDRLGFYFPC